MAPDIFPVLIEEIPVAVEAFDPTREAVTVTPAAVEHFKRQLAVNKGADAVRLSIRQSGCTGYMYVVDLVAGSNGDDLHLPLADGIELLIDLASLPVVSGTQIDYVIEGVNRQLKFLNPNAKDYCGCGESFSVN